MGGVCITVGPPKVHFTGNIGLTTPTLAAQSAKAVSGLKKELGKAHKTIESLLEQVKLANQYRFGSSSEKVVPEQLSLFNGCEAACDPKAPEPVVDDILPRAPRRLSPGL